MLKMPFTKSAARTPAPAPIQPGFHTPAFIANPRMRNLVPVGAAIGGMVGAMNPDKDENGDTNRISSAFRGAAGGAVAGAGAGFLGKRIWGSKSPNAPAAAASQTLMKGQQNLARSTRAQALQNRVEASPMLRHIPGSSVAVKLVDRAGFPNVANSLAGGSSTRSRFPALPRQRGANVIGLAEGLRSGEVRAQGLADAIHAPEQNLTPDQKANTLDLLHQHMTTEGTLTPEHAKMIEQARATIKEGSVKVANPLAGALWSGAKNVLASAAPSLVSSAMAPKAATPAPAPMAPAKSAAKMPKPPTAAPEEPEKEPKKDEPKAPEAPAAEPKKDEPKAPEAPKAPETKKEPESKCPPDCAIEGHGHPEKPKKSPFPELAASKR